MADEPSLLTPGLDRALGFCAGFFGVVMGILVILVLASMWARRGEPADLRARRRHAASVSRWSFIGMGAVIVFVAVVVFSLAATGHELV